jgi:hypothetical protein
MSTKKVIIRKVALLLSKKTVEQKFQYARAVVIAMTGNNHFPTPSPALSVITTDANNLETAYIAAQTRAKGTTAQKNAMAKVLQLSLQALAHYVETIANADPNNAEAIITSAGMQMKKPAVHAPRILHVVASSKGQVTLTCPVTKNASYRWDVAIGDPTIEANWKMLVEVKQSKVIQNGLISGTLYHFRQWTIGLKGLGPVSQIVSTTVL